MTKKLDFLFFDAGGGHRSAANALSMVIEERALPWEIRMVNLQELLEPLDVFRKLTGLRLEDVYNLMLKKGWTLGSPQLTSGMHVLIRMYHSRQVRLLERFWAESRPEMVVSLIPNFNRAVWQSLRNTLPAVPMVTILTDIADYPPHFWMERQEQYLICGSQKAVEQALALGHARERVLLASGMILHPKFYQPVQEDRAAGRRRLGLDPDRPTALVMFGGQGARVMCDIAQQLEVQAIFICGHNQKLAEKLRGLRTRAPIFVEGFTTETPQYMHLADFFIGKAGPGSISEALAMGLPVIVERNAWTLPQERYNTVWVREKQVGLVLKNFRKVDRAVAELLDPATFARFRSNAAALGNRAVFEIPDMLEKILESAAHSAGNVISST